jgi:hypothetical protein
MDKTMIAGFGDGDLQAIRDALFTAVARRFV